MPAEQEDQKEILIEPIKKLEKASPVEEVPSFEKKQKFFKKKWFLISFSILAFLLIVFGATAGFAYSVYKSFLPEKAILEQSAIKLKEATKAQDLVLIKKETAELRTNLDQVKQKVEKYHFLSSLPKVKNYYQDVQHLFNAGYTGLDSLDTVVDAISPYADLLGLAPAEDKEGKTTLDRITFLVTTLDKIRPDLDKIGTQLESIKSEIDQIDANRYPTEIKGFKIRENLLLAISTIDQASSLVNDAKPLLEELPNLLGVTSPKYYLVIFQNDAELRPTGGFMTAYGVLKVDQGKVSPVLSEDIYSLDNAWGKKLPAPDSIKNYHKNVPYLYLRDMNLSPDFAVSMEPILNIYNNEISGTKDVDGIIGVDTQFLASLLKVLGTIGVPEWGNFSAEIDKRCDCPQVVYRLEEIADKPISGQNASRKAVIGPLMHSILSNAFNSPKDKVAALFNTGLTAIKEKHVLFYLTDEKAQKAVESFNLAGRVRDYSGDYQLLVDTNFAGAKSNLFITQKVEEKIEVSTEGEVTKTITVTYNNPFPPSDCGLLSGGLCLNGLYRDWFRLYVPQGSQLIEMTGSEVEPKVYDELGKTVFEGFYGDKYPLRPQSMTKISFKYKLPEKVNPADPYQLLIQKQPGVEKYQYVLDFNGQTREFELREDKELRL